jgi:hypothetical protein
MTEPTTINLVREKETKNTVRFSEQTQEGQPPLVGTMYLQKRAAGDVKSLKVTIEPA